MEDTGDGNVAAGGETVGPESEATEVSLNTIFKVEDGGENVIVIQGAADGASAEGTLPDLTDAVTDTKQPQAVTAAMYPPADGTDEIVSSTVVEDGQPTESDDAAEGQHFVTESVQDIQALHTSDEVIFINSDQVKDDDVQCVEMEQAQTADQGEVSQSQFTERAGVPTRRTIVRTVRIPDATPRKTTYISKSDIKTRFLCPVCEKSFRQKHLLLCHLKLHEGSSKPKSTSVYMSNCTTCGGNVRLTSEQARLLQERGTEDARIICSTCKLLGHDVMQPKNLSTVPIELKPAYNFNCDLCGCDIKLTDDQLQLVDRKGAENIRIICAPCSMKDQEQGPPELMNLKCQVCQRTIVAANQETIDLASPTCAECQAKNVEDATAVDNVPGEEAVADQEYLQYGCSACGKEIYLTSEPQQDSDLFCLECSTRDHLKKVPPSRLAAPTSRPRFPYIKGVRELKPPNDSKVDGLAVMYKCNNCFCSMQVSEEQKQLLKSRGVSGMKIICSACNSKSKPAAKKKANQYQCDICLSDMDSDYVPSRDDDDIICSACRKAEQRDKIRKVKSTELFKCITCNKYLPLTNSQMVKILRKNPRPRLQCELCRKKIAAAEEKIDFYRCDICSMSFGSNFDAFTAHFEEMHVPDPETTRKMWVRCPICDFGFNDWAKLKVHLRAHKPKKYFHRPCHMCGTQFRKSAMFTHYKTAHDINIETDLYMFKLVGEMRNWIEGIEASTCSKFIMSDDKAYMMKTTLCVNLYCHWSVLYKSKLAKRKNCVFCPAQIRIRETRNGIFALDFTKTHVGHDLLTNDYSLSEIELMKGFLREGKNIADVVAEFTKGMDSSSEEYSRFYQLKNYDEYALSLKLADVELIRKFKRESSGDDDVDDDDSGLSDRDPDAEWLDLPRSLDWVRQLAAVEETPDVVPLLKSTAVVRMEESDDAFDLKFQSPSVPARPFAQKKLDVLRRLTEVLNICSSDDHFDILEIYLNPCEETLRELTSGKKVEVVDDDEMEVTFGTQNDVGSSEAADCPPAPSPKRPKND